MSQIWTQNREMAVFIAFCGGRFSDWKCIKVNNIVILLTKTDILESFLLAWDVKLKG